VNPGNNLVCLVSFEGPDDYARVGGLAERVARVAGELADAGYETHLVYFGDPQRPSVERIDGHLTVHRWAQQLSARHLGGVYTAEDERRAELAGSLPGYLMDNMIRPLVRARFTPVILATEWQTFDFLSTLDRLLETEGQRRAVVLAWELAAPSLGRFDWSRVPHGIQLLSRDREVILAGAAAGRVVVHIGEGAEALRMALMGERNLTHPGAGWTASGGASVSRDPGSASSPAGIDSSPRWRRASTRGTGK
jgi:hypothetical protein